MNSEPFGITEAGSIISSLSSCVNVADSPLTWTALMGGPAKSKLNASRFATAIALIVTTPKGVGSWNDVQIEIVVGDVVAAVSPRRNHDVAQPCSSTDADKRFGGRIIGRNVFRFVVRAGTNESYVEPDQDRDGDNCADRAKLRLADWGLPRCGHASNPRGCE